MLLPVAVLALLTAVVRVPAAVVLGLLTAVRTLGERQATATCRSHAHHMYVTCRSHAHHMYVTCRSHASHMYVTCKSHAGHMQVTCMSHAGHMQVHVSHASHVSHAGPMQVTCMSHASHMYVTCRSHASHMQVTCPPSASSWSLQLPLTLPAQSHWPCSALAPSLTQPALPRTQAQPLS